ncbi:MAG: hypothetical protein C4527_00750 [Candidatus Omnitrophota bacterium]|jgi:hypothetical protein|nr:MAG: hypothetical protein C4527_00750 [Candidatus Omnitrophota bacterium]
MVTLFGIPNQGQALFGAGLGGFLNGQPLGNQEENPLLGGLARKGLSQSNQSRLGLLASPSSSLLKSLQQKQEKDEIDSKKKEEKEDRLELSQFAENAVEQAVNQARKSPQVGATNQIIVSEDGRFEASIDLRLHADGSFDLDLAVSFAQSGVQQLQSLNQTALPESTNNPESNQKPVNYNYNSTQAAYQRYTSFEQILQTRDFEARIFFEESKSAAMVAEQAYGSEMGNNVLSVAKEVSHEFTLNLSISGSDLSNFNAAVEELSQFDDTGTLGGFLSAVQGVLHADSGNLGSFLDATTGLINASRDHVGAKLNNFFTGMNEEYGGMLEEIGFEPDYLKNIGNDVQKDLNTFFDVTNSLLSGLFGENQIEDKSDGKNNELNILEESLQQMKEERRQILQGKSEDKNPFAQAMQDPYTKPAQLWEV